MLRIDLDAVELEHHRRSGHGAAFAAQGPIRFDTTKRIVTPFFVSLTERWHRQPKPMKKISPAAGRKLSLPRPVDLQRYSCNEQDKDHTENDEGPSTFQSTTL